MLEQFLLLLPRRDLERVTANEQNRRGAPTGGNGSGHDVKGDGGDNDKDGKKFRRWGPKAERVLLIVVIGFSRQ